MPILSLPLSISLSLSNKPLKTRSRSWIVPTTSKADSWAKDSRVQIPPHQSDNNVIPVIPLITLDKHRQLCFADYSPQYHTQKPLNHANAQAHTSVYTLIWSELKM